MRILSILLMLFALADGATAQTRADLLSLFKKTMSEEAWQYLEEDSQRRVDEGIPLSDALQPLLDRWNEARARAEADLAWSQAFFPDAVWNALVTELQRALYASDSVLPVYEHVEQQRALYDPDWRGSSFEARQQEALSAKVSETAPSVEEAVQIESRTVYEVVQASSGNTLEIDVSNTLSRPVESVRVVARQIPAWLDLNAAEVMLSSIEQGATATAHFTFSVDAEAPPGEVATLLFDVSTPTRHLVTQEITLRIGLPEAFALFRNYPNPFNPSTEIAFALPRAAQVSLGIYNVLGQRVATLAEGDLEAGRHQTTWHAGRFASGIYFYVLTVQEDGGRQQVFREKMMLVK